MMDVEDEKIRESVGELGDRQPALSLPKGVL